jgi:hypothetical protein
VTKEPKHLSGIELHFWTLRESLARNARFICQAVPKDVTVLFGKLTRRGNQHMRIALPSRYSEEFAEELRAKIYLRLNRRRFCR